VVFAVVEVHWASNGDRLHRSADSVTPVRVFTKREKAEKLRRQCERKARVERNPFELNGWGWEMWTSVPQEEFRRRIEELGLTPPNNQYDDEWRHWWWETRMTAKQSQELWGLIDKAALYEVAEVELPGWPMGQPKARGTTLFLVVRLGWWAWHSAGYERFPDSEGRPCETGRPVAAYADRNSAEARCATLEAEARATVSPFAFFGAWPGRLGEYSSLPVDKFENRLRRALPGIKLPGKDKQGNRGWVRWWDETVDRLTDEQRSKVWALLDRLHFCAIVPAEL
jgi:hypothetical protein